MSEHVDTSIPAPSSQALFGVEAVLSGKSTPTLFSREFSLAGRVALVSGGQGGLGLDSALALIEAGASVVYCTGRAETPGETWKKVREYVGQVPSESTQARLEYIQADASDQEKMWKVAETIGDKEGRLDICVVAHGVGGEAVSCLDFPGSVFQKVLDINTNGMLYAAQACGRQMDRFGHGGSIILMASMAGSVTLRNFPTVAYNASKAATIQIARSMACELAPKNIRVNSVSAGYILTGMTASFREPSLQEMVASQNPMGRIGKPHEIRGVVTWLASDASSFCTGSNIVVDGGHCAW